MPGLEKKKELPVGGQVLPKDQGQVQPEGGSGSGQAKQKAPIVLASNFRGIVIGIGPDGKAVTMNTYGMGSFFELYGLMVKTMEAIEEQSK